MRYYIIIRENSGKVKKKEIYKSRNLKKLKIAEN